MPYSILKQLGRVLALVALVVVLPGAVLAKGAARVANPTSHQNLADNNEMPKWSRETVREFCRAKYGSSEYERKSCVQVYSNEIGHHMIPADFQQLQSGRKAAPGAVGATKLDRSAKDEDKAPAEASTPQFKSPPLGDHYSINDVPPTHR